MEKGPRVLKKRAACWLQIETLRDADLSSLSMDTRVLQPPFQIPEQNMGADSNSPMLFSLVYKFTPPLPASCSLAVVLTKTFPSDFCVQGMHQQGAENTNSHGTLNTHSVLWEQKIIIVLVIINPSILLRSHNHSDLVLPLTWGVIAWGYCSTELNCKAPSS